MNSKLTIVMAHAGTEDTVKRHRKFWTGTVVFTGPKGLEPKLEGETVVSIGEAEHSGIKSAHRIKQILEYALSRDDWTVFELNEYDSFATEEVKPKPGGVTATVYRQNKPGRFIASFYMHYPHFYTRAALQSIKKEVDFLIEQNNTADVLFSDRLIGYAAELSHVTVTDLRAIKKAYSKNTVNEKHYDALRLALREGAVSFHGVKTQQVFDIINNQLLNK